MCTSPNYLVWNGDYRLRTIRKKTPLDSNPILPSDFQTDISFGSYVPKFEFIGKRFYDAMIDCKSPWIQVPCGQCLECRIQQARTWADRVVLEASHYQFNYFVTLTYDDENLPNNLSLNPRDLTLFLKRLRKKFTGIKIRYFACGEYGDKSRRPHFHLILFNCPLNDLSYDFYYKKGDKLIHKVRPNQDLYFSQTIFDCWNQKGMISVGAVSYDSAAYVSQYVTKKHKPGMKEFYEKLGITPEFVRVSTHPGLAYLSLEDIDLNILNNEKLIVASKGEAHLSSVFRYAEKQFIQKYGDQVFNTVRFKRYKDRINKRNQYCISDHSLKSVIDSSRNSRIEKLHHLKGVL